MTHITLAHCDAVGRGYPPHQFWFTSAQLKNLLRGDPRYFQDLAVFGLGLTSESAQSPDNFVYQLLDLCNEGKDALLWRMALQSWPVWTLREILIWSHRQAGALAPDMSVFLADLISLQSTNPPDPHVIPQLVQLTSGAERVYAVTCMLLAGAHIPPAVLSDSGNDPASAAFLKAVSCNHGRLSVLGPLGTLEEFLSRKGPVRIDVPASYRLETQHLG